MGLHVLVGLALQHLDAFQFIIGEVLRPALHRLVPGRTQETSDSETLCQMLLVVPAIEVRFFVCRHISPDH